MACLALVLAAAVAACGSSAPTPRLTDAKEILSQSAASLSSVTTAHVKAEVLKGSVPAALLGSLLGGVMPGAGGGASGSDLPIDASGLTAEGDVDVADAALKMSIVAPSSLFSVKADVVKVGTDVYLRSTLFSGNYTKLQVPAGSASSIMTDPLPAVRSLLGEWLAKPGTSATFKGLQKVNGSDCYHVVVTLPQDQLDAALQGTGASLTNATVDVWSYFADMRPAKLELKATSSGKPLDVLVTITNYDKSVSISAPPADQISSSAS